MNKRKELWSDGPVGPWRAKVSISAVGTNFGRATSLPYDTLFDVVAEWVGPPAFGFPKSDIAVSVSTSAVVTTYSGALQVAKTAVDVLRAGKVPDLRTLAGEHSAAAPTGLSTKG